MSTRGQFAERAFIEWPAVLLRISSFEIRDIRWAQLPGQRKEPERIEDILQIVLTGALPVEIVDA